MGLANGGEGAAGEIPGDTDIEGVGRFEIATIVELGAGERVLIGYLAVGADGEVIFVADLWRVEEEGADGGALLLTVGDEDGGDALANGDAVRVAEAADDLEMSRGLKVEDLKGAMVFGGKQQAITVVVDGEVVEARGRSGEVDTMEELLRS